MINFIRGWLKLDSQLKQERQAWENQKRIDDDDDRARQEEMLLERIKWEIRNNINKKKDAAYLQLQKTTFDSYEQYQASRQKLGSNKLAQYANMQAQMKLSGLHPYHNHIGIFG